MSASIGRSVRIGSNKNRQRQVWRKPSKTHPGQPSRFYAEAKGEKGAIPVKVNY